MQDLNDKITGNTLTATEWNEVPSELQNVIEKTGQALSGADLDQLGKGIATYAAGGDHYTDGGAANAYVLTVVGTKKAPAVYFDGMRVRFVAANTNTGASTVNVASLGVKNIKSLLGTDPSAGKIAAGDLITLRYVNASGWFVIEDIGSHLEIGGGANNNVLNLYKADSSACSAQFTNLTTGNTSTDGFKVGITSAELAQIWNYENTEMLFATNNLERMRILAGGNVNIGGSHNTNRLMVHQGDSGACYTQFTNTTTGVAATDGFKVGISASEEALIYNYENTAMKFSTNSADRLFIAADGGIYTNGATGGSKGVDTINAKQFYGNGYLFFDDVPPTGYRQGGCLVQEGDHGSESGYFNIISSLTHDTTETVGPTGSGATNIWTDMNTIPAGARFILFKVYCYQNSSASVYIFAAGSTLTVGDSRCIIAAASYAGVEETITQNTIPLDTNEIFRLRWYNGAVGSAGGELWFQGWL